METPYGAKSPYSDLQRQSSDENGTDRVQDDCRFRIDAISHLNAFTRVFKAPVRLPLPQGSNPRALEAMDVAVKSNICVAGQYVSCGSSMLEAVTAPYHATAVRRLLEAGAVIRGTTNMDEFGMGSSTEYSVFGPTLNPYNQEHVAGGSSGGSAVSVATGAVHAALGSDTGGSVRQPAAFCGIVGFKPSYGRISRNGLVAFSSSCDHIGIMTRSVEDAARVFSAISGEDPEDASSAGLPPWNELDRIDEDIEDVRFAVPAEYLSDDLQEECRNAVVRAIALLIGSGIEAGGAHLPMTPYAVAANYVIANAEASANLARYDGIRFGSDDRVRPYTFRSSMFGEEVQRRLIFGTHLTTANGGERYRRAMKVRQKIANEFEQIFKKYDILITPTTAGTAFRLGERTEHPRAMYLSDALNTPANMAGIPAISIPVGVDANGLPVGLQLMAARMNETVLLRAARALHQGLHR